MAKKIYLSPSSQPENTYAVGNTNEQEQCRRIAAAARDALIRCGFEAKAGMEGTMYTRARESNTWGADLHVPIHTNAWKGLLQGSRMFCSSVSGEGGKACKAILNVLAPLVPGDSDGVQSADFYEITATNAPCAYVEAAFHDHKEQAQWIIDHVVDIGEAICKGICDYYGVEYAAPESVPTQEEKPVETPVEAENTIYRVQVGAFRNKQYAYNMLEELRSHGYDGFVVPVNLK
jgi:N-acetylmuramoyl-L-alanine amidase